SWRRRVHAQSRSLTTGTLLGRLREVSNESFERHSAGQLRLGRPANAVAPSGDGQITRDEAAEGRDRDDREHAEYPNDARHEAWRSERRASAAPARGRPTALMPEYSPRARPTWAAPMPTAAAYTGKKLTSVRCRRLFQMLRFITPHRPGSATPCSQPRTPAGR